MLPLDQKYQSQLDELAKEIQASDELAAYLETEEDDDFNILKEQYEPRIAVIYDKVAEEDPLQLVALEKKLLSSDFEGLYLPKILGFSVLRGELNERLKYLRPQEHFKDVLMAVCNSSNFDILKKRIGQTIQMGFAFSSDIWVTNLIAPVSNKRVRYYLQGNRLDRYRQLEERKTGNLRYRRQFTNENYQSAEFPTTLGELKVLFVPLKNFLMYRVKSKYSNDSIVPHLHNFIANEAFHGSREHLEIMAIYAMFFELQGDEAAHLHRTLNEVRKNTPEFAEMWLEFLLELHKDKSFDLNPEADKPVSGLLDRSIKDQLSEYYDLMDTIHDQGYISDEAQEAVKSFYNRHEGLSTINECVRATIFSYFRRFLTNLEEHDYTELFEITKTYAVYMGIFLNQQFNQDLKDLSMKYVKRLLKTFTDKRGKDYQDIKKFVSTTFQDLNFLKEKEVVELFKTRRKRRKPKE